MPSFQNPAGVTLSAERRRRLVELAREREVLVVEDNPYGLLRYEGEALPPLYQLDGGDYVLYLGTFSKILSPGIRLGWAVAPPPVMEKIVLGKQATDLCTSTLTQYFVGEYFAEGRWRDYVDEPVEHLPRATRRDGRGARAPLPAAGEWTEPDGGLFLWATLPGYIDTSDLLAKALRDNVAFVPGARGLRRRARAALDAAQLLRRRAGRDPRGDPADRRGRLGAGRALRDDHGRAPHCAAPGGRRR